MSSLRLRFTGDSGLASFNQYPDGSAGVQLWRSVFERLAPESVARIEGIIGQRLGDGTGTRQITFELLCALRHAYLRETIGQPSSH